jgi:hypothetical protein
VSTVLLLNGGSLVDATGRHTISTNDGTVTSSGGLLSFDGASALRIDDNLSDFAFAGSFTIEGQINGVSAGAGTAVFLSNYDGSAQTFELFTRGLPNYNGGWYAPFGDYQESSTPAWINDTTHDFAFVYDAATGAQSLYLDGTRISTSTGQPHGYNPTTPPSLYIGRESATSTKFLKGLLRLRIDNGVALYTGASYTPPSWPIPYGTLHVTADQTADPAAQAATIAAIASVNAAQASDQALQAATAVVIARLQADQLAASADQVATFLAIAAARSLTADQLVPVFAQIVRFQGPYVFKANGRTYVVGAEDRLHVIDPQSRTYVAPPQDRNFIVLP